MQLNLHTRCVRQVDHQENAQVLQGDPPVALPEGLGGVGQLFVFAGPSNRQLTSRL